MARFSSSANDIDEGRRVCLLLVLLVVLEDDLRTPTPTKFEFPGVVVREAARMFGGAGAGGGAGGGVGGGGCGGIAGGVGASAGAGGGAGGGAGAGAGAGESVGTRAEVAGAGDGVSNASVSNAAAGAVAGRVVDATPAPTGGGSGDDGDPTGAGPSDVPASVQGPSDGDAGGSGDDQVGQGLSAAAAGVADADGDVAMRATPRHARPKPLDDEVLALRQPLHGDAPLPQASVALVISTLTQGDQCEDAARQLEIASCPAQTLLQLCRCVRCVVACA